MLPRPVERLVWAIRVGWRIVNGRWFCFRDAPTWFVAEMSAIGGDASDASVRAMGQQAMAELEHRVNNLRFRAAREHAAIMQSLARMEDDQCR
jgi:hypothetical protein